MNVDETRAYTKESEHGSYNGVGVAQEGEDGIGSKSAGAERRTGQAGCLCALDRYPSVISRWPGFYEFESPSPETSSTSDRNDLGHRDVKHRRGHRRLRLNELLTRARRHVVLRIETRRRDL